MAATAEQIKRLMILGLEDGHAYVVEPDGAFREVPLAALESELDWRDNQRQFETLARNP